MDADLSCFGAVPETVRIVLERCNLIRYLCQKAAATGYLSHFERLSVLYVFGHLGDDGKEFVHTVMGFTLNYQYNITQKFILKLPAKPVSCVKLREQYKLTRQIVELKKQRRGLDKVIGKVEEELEKIFDNAGIDCIETEMGMLVRRKKTDGYEWLIEL